MSASGERLVSADLSAEAAFGAAFVAVGVAFTTSWLNAHPFAKYQFLRKHIVIEMHLSLRNGNDHILLHSCTKCLLHFLPIDTAISISVHMPLISSSFADSYDRSYRVLSAWETAPSAGCPQEGPSCRRCFFAHGKITAYRNVNVDGTGPSVSSR